MERPSNQEMFNRAVRGLHAQSWRRAVNLGRCVYLAENGDRCAWGHVDPEGTEGVEGGVADLRRRAVGLAAALSIQDTAMGGFASRLQAAHDQMDRGRTPPVVMRAAFQRLARDFGLTWPDDVPVPGEG